MKKLLYEIKEKLLENLMYFVVAIVIAAIVFLLTGCTSEPKKEHTYTVQKGDTLYTIAQDLGIEDWRKFRYETCKNNGLEQGGLIFTGQEIVICY